MTIKHLIFDTETTQLISNSLRPLDKQPRIIEFFGLIIESEQGEFLDNEHCLHSFLNPGIEIPAEVTKITNITNEMINEAPSFKEFYPALKEFFKSVDILVAHNISYDIGVITFELSRIGMSDSDLFNDKRHVCTVETTEFMNGHRLKLSDLYKELFAEDFKDAHRAENDVRALARCYKELVRRGEV